jgi:hypothetical protein
MNLASIMNMPETMKSATLPENVWNSGTSSKQGFAIESSHTYKQGVITYIYLADGKPLWLNLNPNTNTQQVVFNKSESVPWKSTLRDSGQLLIEKVRSFAVLEDTWDGECAKAPTAKAIQEAEDFIYLLKDRRILDEIEQPIVSLMNDGEINFWWNLPEARFDIGFYGSGIYSYYAKIKDKEFGEDDKEFSNIEFDLQLLVILLMGFQCALSKMKR